MQLRFAKMHGLGNDFMVVDWPEEASDPDTKVIRQWADRHLGVGFDQLLLVSDIESPRSAARYRIFNADGGEVEQCGNGARCIARFLRPKGEDSLLLVSSGGTVEASVRDDGMVRVNLGEPNFAPDAVPFDATVRAERYALSLGSGEVRFGIVSMGNPHAVIAVDSVDAAEVGILGAELAVHPRFPQGVNVGFMQRDSSGRIRLRVYERGVGETLACGTGAAAAVAVGYSWGELADEVEVSLPGGVLSVRWPGPGSPLWQTGPTTMVYEGRIEL